MSIDPVKNETFTLGGADCLPPPLLNLQQYSDPGEGALSTVKAIMTSRDNGLWLQCWRDRRTDFNQATVNHLLTRFWPGLDLARGSRVFVPLCGKSLDMIWLAGQGHEVIGVELSPIAVRAFFRENHLQPTRRKVGKFVLWQHGRLSILCGDYFSLTIADLGRIDTVYDRAALTALPEDIRGLYIAHLRLIVPETITVFLLTTEDAEETETPSQVFGIAEEINILYSEGFDIDLAHVESIFEADPESPNQPPGRTEYKVYRLTTRLVFE
jgi:thiopurine S-methyltransferase